MLAEAFRKKINIKKIQSLSKIDNWFLEQIKEIVDTEIQIKKKGLPKNYVEFNRIKSIGFSLLYFHSFPKEHRAILQLGLHELYYQQMFLYFEWLDVRYVLQ